MDGGDYFQLSTVPYLREHDIKVTVRYERIPTWHWWSKGKTHPIPYLGERPYSPTTKFEVPGARKLPADVGPEPYPRGGSVTITLTLPNGITLIGESHCHPLDNFDRKKGLQKAIVRTQWWKYLT